MKNPVVFDIETAPLPDKELEALLPAFDPGAVAVGNLKDEEKIAAKIRTAAANHFAEFKAKAALSASTGRVFLIGYKRPKQPLEYIEGDEKDIITSFFFLFSDSAFMVGHNCRAFDVPFLVRRAYILGLKVPDNLFERRYLSDKIIDTMELWDCGQRRPEEKSPVFSRSLGFLSKAFGGEAKDGDGAHAWELYLKDRQACLEYCGRDVEMTEFIARKMGVIQ